MSGPRTAAAVAALVLGVTGCTRHQLDAWVGWYQADPTAAVDYAATPEVRAQLATAPSSGGVAAGDCASYHDLFAAYGLPVSTFSAIAWRESGCDHTRFTNDSDDLGGFLLGENFRTANLRAGWLSWCGATLSNIRYDPDLQVRCAAAAYHRLGLAPWS